MRGSSEAAPAHTFSGLFLYDAIALVTAGYGTFSTSGNVSDSDYLTAARTPDGALVMAYMPTRRTITVDMIQLSGPVTARCYNPANECWCWRRHRHTSYSCRCWRGGHSR